MELYIDKEFLDNFYIDYHTDKIQDIVKNIITEYGSKQVFINFKEEDFYDLENDNELFALISNIIPPTPVDSIKEYLFSKSTFDQTLIFMAKKEDWFTEAENKGALCFSFDNYQKMISDIVDDLHFRIDLSDGFDGWGFLKKFNRLNYNTLFISDGYILTDQNNQKIEDNLIPILKNFIYNKKGMVTVPILTKELNPISEIANHKKEKAKKRYRKLNSSFANYKVKFSIIINNFSSNFNFHDRNITTNFSLMECGEGFNLLPYKSSNSKIESYTIFDKFTYNRLNRLNRNKKKYIEYLKKVDTSQFKMYP